MHPFLRRLAVVLAAVVTFAPLSVSADGLPPDIHLVPLPASDHAPVLTARAGPANDTQDGALDLGTVFPTSRTFTFAGATTGHVEAFPQAAGTLWFKLKATKSGLLSATIAPATAGDRLVLGLGFWTGFVSVGLQPFAEATSIKPVKVTIGAVKGRTYYLSAALLAPTTKPGDRLRKVKVTLRQPATGVVIQEEGFFEPWFKRDPDGDTIAGGGQFTIQGWGRGGQPGEMSATVTYASGPKNFMTVTGTERRSVDLRFVVSGAIPTIPDSLRTETAALVVTTATDHTFGNTLPPKHLRIYSDTGAAKAAIVAYVPRRPAAVTPGGTAQVGIVVGVPAAGEPGAAFVPTTATGCKPLSPRPITWRWYDKAGKTPLAAAGKPISIAVGRWAQLKAAVPTSASRPERSGFVEPGIVIDCSNTAIYVASFAEAGFSVTTTPPPPVSIEILDADRKVDLFQSTLTPIDVKVTNRSNQPLRFRLLGVFPFSIGNSFSQVPPSCVVGPGGCTERFTRDAFFTVGAGKSGILRYLPRPTPPNLYLGPNEAFQRFRVYADVLVDQQLDTQIFRSVDRDSIAVTMNCPQRFNGGCKIL